MEYAYNYRDFRRNAKRKNTKRRKRIRKGRKIKKRRKMETMRNRETRKTERGNTRTGRKSTGTIRRTRKKAASQRSQQLQ